MRCSRRRGAGWGGVGSTGILNVMNGTRKVLSRRRSVSCAESPGCPAGQMRGGPAVSSTALRVIAPLCPCWAGPGWGPRARGAVTAGRALQSEHLHGRGQEAAGQDAPRRSGLQLPCPAPRPLGTTGLDRGISVPLGAVRRKAQLQVEKQGSRKPFSKGLGKAHLFYPFSRFVLARREYVLSRI